MSPHRRLQRLHRMLDVGCALVPAAEREAWRAEWVAELSYVQSVSPDDVASLAQGMLPDACAMRWRGWQRQIQQVDWRAPEVCLQTLAVCFAVIAAITAAQPHLRHLVFSKWGYGAFGCFFALALFSLPSTIVTSGLGAYESFEGEARSFAQRFVRWRFLVVKMVLVVLSSYLLAVHVTQPFQHRLGERADWLLLACGVLFNVIGVNWVLKDQKARCPTCMRLLRSPARIGPPSWSFLDWTGMEEICDRGHGLLHQPQWETSWYENARWLQLDRTWRELFRP